MGLSGPLPKRLLDSFPIECPKVDLQEIAGGPCIRENRDPKPGEGLPAGGHFSKFFETSLVHMIFLSGKPKGGLKVGLKVVFKDSNRFKVAQTRCGQ